jgi:hypothetical protein
VKLSSSGASASRFYDPTTGQFTSRDPANAMTRSAYGYTHGNPLNGTDPLGLYWGQGVVHKATHAAGSAAKAVVDHAVSGATYGEADCIRSVTCSSQTQSGVCQILCVSGRDVHWMLAAIRSP